MQKFKPQYRRLLFIDGKIKEGKFPNCTSLAVEWEVSGKTIQRDIDYLRDELEAPIGYDALERGFYYTEPSYSLPAIRVSESDLFSVFMAETVLGHFRNTPLYGKLSSVFRKIRDSLPDKTTTVNPAWLGDRILVFPEPATRVRPAVWDTLAKAIRDNRRVSLAYTALAGKRDAPVRRTVDPYYLVSYKGEWYLSSYCHHRQAIRTFGVSRITKARVLDEAFSMPAGMTVKRMFGDQFGIVRRETFEKVRIRFAPRVAPYIRERQWHPTQRITERRDGGLVLEFTTNHVPEVMHWILSWGEDATALAPEEMVRNMAQSLKHSLAHYPPRPRPSSSNR